MHKENTECAHIEFELSGPVAELAATGKASQSG